MRRKSIMSNPAQLTFDFNAIIEEMFRTGCIINITNTLPKLFDHQQEDVMKAEKRFEEGKGVMFTNGTGVGKTFLGLGLIKRFFMQGKKEILIVVPTDKKAKDWIEEAEHLDLRIYKRSVKPIHHDSVDGM